MHHRVAKDPDHLEGRPALEDFFSDEFEHVSSLVNLAKK